MIQDFSQGYYSISMDVQKYDDGPVIEASLYTFIQQELFSSDDPVIMRVGLGTGSMFDVSSESAVPRDVLALPEWATDEFGQLDVFILKPEYQDTVGGYNG